MDNTVRAFVAIELNPEIKDTIRQTRDHFKALNCDVKWVKPENAHLTLKFLGNVKLKHVDPLIETLDILFKKMEPIPTELTRLGAFPNPERPRVFWIGLQDTEGKISQLAESIENALGKIGFKKEERAFAPHITIGRPRGTKNLAALSAGLAQYVLPAAPAWTIQSVTLFKSTLTSSGPVYEILKKFDFSDA